MIISSRLEIIVHFRIHVHTNIKKYQFFSRLKYFYKAKDAAEAKSPHGNENIPEIIMN
jgi:hypothetical protein